MHPTRRLNEQDLEELVGVWPVPDDRMLGVQPLDLHAQQRRHLRHVRHTTTHANRVPDSAVPRRRGTNAFVASLHMPSLDIRDRITREREDARAALRTR